MGKNKTSRLNFLVDQAVKDRLDRLKGKSGTYVTVLRNALATYELLMRERQQGAEIILKNGEDERIMVLPGEGPTLISPGPRLAH